MKKKLLLSIVIPCLNEKETVEEAVLQAKKNGEKYFAGKYEVVVADNGSTDGTLKIIKQIKKIRIINVPVRGYGAALHWGILESRGIYVIFADADLSYPFSNIGQFKKMLSDKPDLVLGSRFRGKIERGAMPLTHRYLGTPVLTFLIRLLYKIPTTDCNSGMRLVRKSFYRKLNMRSSGMEWASEVLLKTALKKGKYLEVPILFRKDKREKAPHLSSWPDGWRHLKAIILLKPSTLYFAMLFFILLTIYFYNISFIATFLFANLTLIAILSLLTNDLLTSIIEGRFSIISKFLIQFKLVPITVLVFLTTAVITFVLPSDFLIMRLFLVSSIGAVSMWIFLIETIKTHLINSLPDRI